MECQKIKRRRHLTPEDSRTMHLDNAFHPAVFVPLWPANFEPLFLSCTPTTERHAGASFPHQVYPFSNDLGIKPLQDLDLVGSGPGTREDILSRNGTDCEEELLHGQVPCDALSLSQAEGDEALLHLRSCIVQPSLRLEFKGLGIDFGVGVQRQDLSADLRSSREAMSLAGAIGEIEALRRDRPW